MIIIIISVHVHMSVYDCYYYLGTCMYDGI